MLDLHGLLSKTITSSFIFKKFVIIGCVTFHGIILKYARSCMDIYSKITSRLEENIDIILCVILTNTKIRNLHQDLTIQTVVVAQLLQIINQQRPLHPLIIHFTLLTIGLNASSPTILLEFQCTAINERVVWKKTYYSIKQPDDYKKYQNKIKAAGGAWILN